MVGLSDVIGSWKPLPGGAAGPTSIVGRCPHQVDAFDGARPSTVGMAVDGSRPSITGRARSARPRLADDAEDLAPADLQRHPSQGPHVLAVAPERDVQVVDGDERPGGTTVIPSAPAASSGEPSNETVLRCRRR